MTSAVISTGCKKENKAGNSKQKQEKVHSMDSADEYLSLNVYFDTTDNGVVSVAKEELLINKEDL